MKKNSKTKASSNTKRNYPKITFEEAMRVPLCLKEFNGGNAWVPREIAKAAKISIGNEFYYYTAASRDFGLTSGTSQSNEISLTPLGKEIVYAPNAQIEKLKKIEAFLKIDIFKKVLEYYKGSNLPDMKYLGNTLTSTFNINPSLHEEFATIFRKNCTDLGITSSNIAENLKDSDANLPSTVIVGEVKSLTGKMGLKAFVIMPFTEKNQSRPKSFFQEVLQNLIIPAGVEAGFSIETANKQGSDIIQSTIINELIDADLVIADLTDHNPNVLFELGVRMAIDKPMALTKTIDTGRIFDIDNMLRVYEYNQNLWKSTLDFDIPNLTEHFKAVWDNKNSDLSYMKILRKQVNI